MARYERRPWGPESDRRARAALDQWAERNAPARKAPKSPSAQARFLRDEVYGGSTRRMADAYGVSQRTVQRWVKGTRKLPAQRERLEREVRDVRTRRAERRARLAARRGQPTRLRVKGWIGPVGATVRGRARGTPTTRNREMPEVDLDPSQTAALIDAYERDDAEAIREVLADRYGQYFGGDHEGASRWVTGADVGEIERIWFE